MRNEIGETVGGPGGQSDLVQPRVLDGQPTRDSIAVDKAAVHAEPLSFREQDDACQMLALSDATMQ